MLPGKFQNSTKEGKEKLLSLLGGSKKNYWLDSGFRGIPCNIKNLSIIEKNSQCAAHHRQIFDTGVEDPTNSV